MTTTTAETKSGGGFWPATLAVAQRIGRSLMLPIAVLPAAALLLRLGQPDLLGPEGLGWDAVADVIGAAGNALFANLPTAVRRRRGDRFRPQGRRFDRARRGGRLPGLQGRWRRDVATHPGGGCRGRGAAAHQLGCARRHPRRHHGGAALAALPPHQARRRGSRSSVAGASSRSSPQRRPSCWPCSCRSSTARSTPA